MGLNETPSGERAHIGFFGVRNAGKSSVVNAVTKEDIPGFDKAAFALYNGTELVRSQEKSSSMSFKTYWSDLDGENVDSLTLEVEVFDE